MGFGREPGGFSRVMLNICRGLLDEGITVDLMLPPQSARPSLSYPYVHHWPLDEQKNHAVSWIKDYLETVRPSTILTNRQLATDLVCQALRRSTYQSRLVIRLGAPVSHKIQQHAWVSRWYHRLCLQRQIQRANALIVNSQGIADDLSRLFGERSTRKTVVIPNPTDITALRQYAQDICDHPWLINRPPHTMAHRLEKSPAVLLSIGRLVRTKNHIMQIEALAQLRKTRPARLIILGEGRQRAALSAAAKRLNVADYLELPGFVANPYAYLARADVFLLSSLFEGSPNVLIESLAVGTPIVSTDCESGPREILAGGLYGRLVPLHDVNGFAQAILQTLAEPPDRVLLQQAAYRYDLQPNIQRYLNTLLG